MPPRVILPVTDKFPVTSVSLSNCIFPVPFGFILISTFVELDEITLDLKSSVSTRTAPEPFARSSKLLLDTVVVTTFPLIETSSIIASARYMFFHLRLLDPILKFPVTLGIKLLVILPTRLIVSELLSPICMLPPSVIFPVTPKFPVTSVSLSNCILPVPFGLILMSAFVAFDEITLDFKSRESIRIAPVPFARSSKLLFDTVVVITFPLIDISSTIASARYMFCH